jgi:hypothetical protein
MRPGVQQEGEATCQKYRAAASGTEAGGSDPEAAAQPSSGGTAPTSAPTHVLLMLTTLSGVYTAAYSRMFPAPSPAANSLVCTPTACQSALQSDRAMQLHNTWLGLVSVFAYRACDTARPFALFLKPSRFYPRALLVVETPQRAQFMTVHSTQSKPPFVVRPMPEECISILPLLERNAYPLSFIPILGINTYPQASAHVKPERMPMFQSSSQSKIVFGATNYSSRSVMESCRRLRVSEVPKFDL